jgi:hypothetical protein
LAPESGSWLQEPVLAPRNDDPAEKGEPDMTQKSVVLALSFSILALAARDAHAQQANCGPHADVLAHLATAYGESRQLIAQAGDTAVLELFASATSGTWSITVTQAGGLTCLVAAGENYQFLAEPLPNSDDDA